MTPLHETVRAAVRAAYHEWTAPFDLPASGPGGAPAARASHILVPEASAPAVGPDGPASDASGGSAGADVLSGGTGASGDADGRTFVTWRQVQTAAEEAANIEPVVRRELARAEVPEAEGFKELVLHEYPRPRRWLSRLLILASVAALGGIVAAHATARHPQAPEARPSVSAPAPAPATPAPPPSRRAVSHPPAPKVPRMIRAALVFRAPCWVRAVADGRTVLVGTSTSGSRAVKAHHTLVLTLGNAGGVGLLVNGHPVHTGSSGQVVNLSFALHNGEIVGP